MTYNPRMAFEELFGSGGPEADRAERRRINRSILDVVTHNVARLRKGWAQAIATGSIPIWTTFAKSSGGFRRIEAYNASGVKRELPDAPIGVPDSWDEHVRMMLDLAGAGVRR